MITQEELKRLLHYDPETGDFTWKEKISNIKNGSIAGTAHRSGYVHITINGKKHRAHRLAWLYMTGEFPKNEIDHINRSKGDNGFKNLRDVTHRQNNMNKPTGTSGHTGVSWHDDSGKWQAYIRTNCKQNHLGYYYDLDDAIKARQQAEKELGVIRL